MKRLTQEEFIERSKNLFRDKYLYDRVDYKNNSTKVELYCTDCKKYFFIQPNNHFMGQGCRKCGIEKGTDSLRYTLEEFKFKAQKIHGDKYDYSLIKEYKNSGTKVPIMCKRHNKIFWQTPAKHVLQKHGCPECSGNTKKTKEDFIFESQKVHGSLFSYEKVEYKNTHTKVQLYCKACKEYFWTIPKTHINNKTGCPKCAVKKNADKCRLTKEEFQEKLQKKHGDKYKLDEKSIYINSQTKILVFCNICKDYFAIIPNNLLKGQQCFRCAKEFSRGEKYIKQFLDSNNFFYVQEYRFEACKYKNCLPFDFAIFEDENKHNLKMLIEMDGLSHYEPVRWTYDITEEQAAFNFKEQKQKDQIKTDYCKNNNIKLVRIPYWDREKIPEILSNLLL